MKRDFPSKVVLTSRSPLWTADDIGRAQHHAEEIVAQGLQAFAGPPHCPEIILIKDFKSDYLTRMKICGCS